jgi:ketosteroid isomerase-like protein
MRHHALARAVVLAAAVLGARAADGQTRETLAAEVREAETAFAATMASRDRAAFAGYVADDAIFFGDAVLRGRSAVVDGWAMYFVGARAPFSWAPQTVEVLESGTLALTSGPVRNPDGRQIGTFNSIWRRDADGRWRVVFDKGCS